MKAHECASSVTVLRRGGIRQCWGGLVGTKYILPTLCFRQHKHLFVKTTLQWIIYSGLSLYTGGF